MTMGFPGVDGVRNTDLKECQEILDVFFDHGHTELDTARVYGSGTTEQVFTSPDSGKYCSEPTSGLGPRAAQSEAINSRYQVSIEHVA